LRITSIDCVDNFNEERRSNLIKHESIIERVSFTSFSSALEMPSSPVLKATPRIKNKMYVYIEIKEIHENTIKP